MDKKNNILRVKLVKSLISCNKNHKLCARGLGLRRINQKVELIDTPAIRGMIRKIYYMVNIDKGNKNNEVKYNF